MTEAILYPTADGYIQAADPQYSDAREGTGPPSADFSAATGGLEWNTPNNSFSSPNYICVDGIYRFDGSFLNPSDVIDSVEFSIYPTVVNEDDGAFIAELRAFDYGASLTTADYIAGSLLGSQTLLASILSSAVTINQQNIFTSEASFVTYIDSKKGGNIDLLLCSSMRRLGTTPTGINRFLAKFSEQTGTDKDPTLTINYTAVTPTGPDLTRGFEPIRGVFRKHSRKILVSTVFDATRGGDKT